MRIISLIIILFLSFCNKGGTINEIRLHEVKCWSGNNVIFNENCESVSRSMDSRSSMYNVNCNGIDYYVPTSKCIIKF